MYILKDIWNNSFFTDKIDRRFNKPRPKWSKNINDAKLFDELNELYLIVKNNYFTDIEIIENPFHKDTINYLFSDKDIQLIDEDNISFEDVFLLIKDIEDCISSNLYDITHKLSINGNENISIKQKLFEYFIHHRLIVNVSLEKYFGFNYIKYKCKQILKKYLFEIGILNEIKYYNHSVINEKEKNVYTVEFEIEYLYDN